MELENEKLLGMANQQTAEVHIGGFVFVTFMIVVGIFGNVHVIFIFMTRVKQSNRKIFILVLGTLDLMTCAAGMPFILYDISHPLTFSLTSECKTMRFYNYFICTSSMFLLIIIAIDRWAFD